MKVTTKQACVVENALEIPMVSSLVVAGFPSPADDHLQPSIDLNTELIKHPAATFFVRVKGDSMKSAGILEGDLLIVDRSLEPHHKSIVVALLNGDFTVKYFHKVNNKILLVAANPDFEPITILPSDDFEVWGVVTNAIHSLKS